jgi:hypothetical protein
VHGGSEAAVGSRLAIGAVVLLVVIGAVYVWARASTGRSTLARALVWMEADVADRLAA